MTGRRLPVNLDVTRKGNRPALEPGTCRFESYHPDLMADEFKKLARSKDPWCTHDNARVAYSSCRSCWMKVKKQRRRIARKKMKIDDYEG